MVIRNKTFHGQIFLPEQRPFESQIIMQKYMEAGAVKHLAVSNSSHVVPMSVALAGVALLSLLVAMMRWRWSQRGPELLVVSVIDSSEPALATWA